MGSSTYEGLELTTTHHDSPQSTETWAMPTFDPAVVLRQEAAAILNAATRQEPISGDRARQFARAVIESMPGGAEALAVLDGGLFAATRLIELAASTARAEEQNPPITQHGSVGPAR